MEYNDLVGWNERNKSIVKQTYEEVFAIQKHLFSWLECSELVRMHPKLWSTWCDLEDQLDQRYNNMTYDGFQDWRTRVLSVWHKLESLCKAEMDEMIGHGLSVTPVFQPWALSFVHDKRKPTDICEIGFVTGSELELYFKKQVTVKELQQKNLQQPREFMGEQLIGPIGLGNDGTGKKFLKDVTPPALQKSAQFAPEFEQDKSQCTHVHDDVQNQNRPDIIGFELEDNEDDDLLELGAITEAWDNGADR